MLLAQSDARPGCFYILAAFVSCSFCALLCHFFKERQGSRHPLFAPKLASYGLELVGDFRQPGWTQPRVPQPGEKVRVTIGQLEEYAILGKWRTTRVVIHPLPLVREDGSSLIWEPANVSGNKERWGNSIEYWAREQWSGPTVLKPDIGVYFDIPDDPRLAGRVLAMNVDMDIIYPTWAGNKRFRNAQWSVSTDVAFRVATPEDVVAYRAWQGAIERFGDTNQSLQSFASWLQGISVLAAFALFWVGFYWVDSRA